METVDFFLFDFYLWFWKSNLGFLPCEVDSMYSAISLALHYFLNLHQRKRDVREEYACARTCTSTRTHVRTYRSLSSLTMWVSETKCRLGSKYFYPLSYLAGSLTNFSNKAFFLSLSSKQLLPRSSVDCEICHSFQNFLQSHSSPGFPLPVFLPLHNVIVALSPVLGHLHFSLPMGMSTSSWL